MSVFDLGGRPIVITGALGRLGTEFCRALLAQGAKVAGLDLQEPGSPQATAWLDGLKAGERAAYVQGDVTERASLERAAEAAAAKLGAIYGLVNNAGLDSPPDAPIEENGPFETYP